MSALGNKNHIYYSLLFLSMATLLLLFHNCHCYFYKYHLGYLAFEVRPEGNENDKTCSILCIAFVMPQSRTFARFYPARADFSVGRGIFARSQLFYFF